MATTELKFRDIVKVNPDCDAVQFTLLDDVNAVGVVTDFEWDHKRQKDKVYVTFASEQPVSQEYWFWEHDLILATEEEAMLWRLQN